MKSQVEKLYNISQKDTRIIIGLMSGTSLDGLDIALCKISGSGVHTHLELLEFETCSYPEPLMADIRKIFAQRQIDQQLLCSLHAEIAHIQAQMINKTLKKWSLTPQQVDAIASHGQTVYHAPQSLTQDYSRPHSTLQIADGDHIALKTGIITLSDFRQKHVAAGGQGAPLAVYGDYLLFTHHTENRLLLNIGGIANFTLLPCAQSPLEAFATDLGPGNTIMNSYMKAYFNKPMDQDAHIAKQGTVHKKLLDALLSHPFLNSNFPKTTGPELFSLDYLREKQQESHSLNLPKEDVMATLNAFSAHAITQGIQKVGAHIKQLTVYISGGGLHNPLLLENIRKNIPQYPVHSMHKLQMNPDAKEACLFALLANQTLAGSANQTRAIKDAPEISMGKISFPH